MAAQGGDAPTEAQDRSSPTVENKGKGKGKVEMEGSKAQYKQPNCCFCVVAVVLVCTVLVVLLFFILWLSLQPKKLHYSLVDASITAYNATTTADAARLTANFTLTIRADNPNRGVSFYYDNINATVQFRIKKNETTLLSTQKIPSFYQRRRNMTNLVVKLTTRDAAIDPVRAKNMTTQVKSSGNVELEVKVEGKVRMRMGAFKVHRNLVVLCKAAKMPVPPSRNKFQKRPCHVTIDF